MGFWILLAFMAIAGVAFVIRPLLAGRQWLLPGVTAAFVFGLSFLLYELIGSPDIESAAPQAAATPTDISNMVEGLAARLEEEPGDVDGWRLLGRSYLQLQRFDEAVEVYRKVVELEDARNASSLVELGEALMAASGQTMSPETVGLFESALALEPNHPSALFWGGIAAANRDETALAADRWQKLLESNPQPEIRNILEQRIAVWRGEPAQAAAAPMAPASEPTAPATPAEATVINIEVADEVMASLPPDTTVFVIARAANQPGPPIAVTRRQLRELPTTVRLSDQDAMIPGRVLSGFDTVEIVVRISLSGTPAAQPGDWSAMATIAPGDTVDLRVSEQID